MPKFFSKGRTPWRASRASNVRAGPVAQRHGQGGRELAGRLERSDLWHYHGESSFGPGPIGHEVVGVVEDVGADVRDIARGALVIAPRDRPGTRRLPTSGRPGCRGVRLALREI